MAGEFPVGQRVTLPGHFPEPVVLEAVRPIGAGYECRVRLPDGSPDEAILSADEAELLFGQATIAGTKVAPAETDKLRLLVESARIDWPIRTIAISRSVSRAFGRYRTRSRRFT
jgi:hypothetical protein